MNRRRLSYLLDWFLLFLFVALLIRPLFRVKYLEAWGSIESTFIADGRFLRDHWIHPNWQPNWYCGTRTDYIYPPALRYGTAVISKAVPKVLPVRAYHIYCAFFYCFGIAAVYLLTRAGSNSRIAGWIAALATALISPSYLFNAQIRDETPWWMPYRLNVLVRYGEGPHVTAVGWIPLALVFSLLALRGGRPVWLVLAGISSAMVVSNNFYGATSLALLFPILAWSVYITHLNRWVWLRAAAIAAMAYGLTAFWLTPSYLQVTLFNMRYVSSPGNAWSAFVFLLVTAGFVLLSVRFARGRRDRTYVVFICGALAIFITNVLGHYFLKFRIMGEPARLYPELDLLFILFTVEMLRRFWVGGVDGSPSRNAIWRKAVAAVVVIAALSTSYRYLQNSRKIFVLDPDATDQVEYRMQDWMSRNMPDSRALAAGSVRFWYNVWHDLPQIGGGSEQGLINSVVMPVQWEVTVGQNFDLSLWWLQLFGADAVLVNEPPSREQYHDFHFPEKFKGRLDVAHNDGAGNIIYKVPRRYPSLARVVERVRLDGLPGIPGSGEAASLSSWIDVIENGPDVPTQTQWIGTDVLRVRGRVSEGQSVFVQVSFDDNWRATSNGQRVPIRPNKLGFMTIDAPPGTEEILLQFPAPFSNQLGRGITALTIGWIAGLLYSARRSGIRAEAA